MDRLTTWNGNRYILPQGRTSDGQSYWRIIADRLAEYENKAERGSDMWVDTRDCVPLADGEYYVQTVYGEVKPLFYTYECGWNTHRDEYGNMFNKYAMCDGYVARWCRIEAPPTVPKEWVDAYLESMRGGE